MNGELVTGLEVKTIHVKRGGNREFYDFRIRCNTTWQPQWLGLRFDSGAVEPPHRAASVCPEAEPISGVQVLRGRTRHALPGSDGVRDWYTFKLRCSKGWREPMGLPFDAHSETRSATCPRGVPVRGVRVLRGFQDIGSVDLYEFQLNCEVASLAESRQQRAAQTGDETYTESATRALGELLEALGVRVMALEHEPPPLHHAFDLTAFETFEVGGDKDEL